MKITQFSLQNFKSFAANAVAPTGLTGLSAVNLLFGHNSSGKSNVLKFLELLFRNKAPQTSTVEVIEDGETVSYKREQEAPRFWQGLIENQPFIFHKNNRSAPIEFSVVIELSGEDFDRTGFNEANLLTQYYPMMGGATNFVLELNGRIINRGNPNVSEINLTGASFNGGEIYRVNANGPTTYFLNNQNLGDGRDLFERLLGSLTGTVLFLDKDRYIVPEKYDGRVTSAKPGSFKNWLHNLSTSLLNYGEFEAFKEFVRKYAVKNTALQNFEPTFAVEGDRVEVILHNGSERLPLDSFGTGIQQVLLILSEIFATKPRVVLIEEIELNLSPTMQQQLTRVFAAMIGEQVIDQVIFTSHSRVLADNTALSIYEVTMDEAGVTTVAQRKEKEQSTFFTPPILNVGNEIANPKREVGKKGLEWD